MAGFHFRLDKVMEWRRRECQAEERRLAASRASLNAVNANIARLQAERLQIGRDLASRSSLLSSEISSLGPYRLGARKKELEWNEDRVQRESAVVAETAVVRTAQRRLRLLEKLRERKLSEFEYAAARDLENLAAETFLSKWRPAKSRGE